MQAFLIPVLRPSKSTVLCFKETLVNGMRESGVQSLVHGKAADSENNCGYLRVLPTQPCAKDCRQIAAGPLSSVS